MADVNWYGNTSGRGTSEGMPPQIKGKWNWGAFLLCPIWAFAHQQYLLAFLSIIPGVNIFAGYVGNEWAWESNEWKDIDHFQRSQRTWARVGTIFWLLSFTMKLLAIILKH